MKLSIITTLYQSEPYLDEFHQRISASALSITDDYELILVNDGSPDQALNKARYLQKTNPKIIIIDLSRNFGHHEAGMIGLNACSGDYIFLIDSDLEEAPELLQQFWTILNNNTETDVVYGIQAIRKGRWSERCSGQIFYYLFNKLSETSISENLLTVRLMKRKFVNAIVQYQEKHLFVAGIMAHAGFNQQAVPVHKASKQRRSYTLSKQLKLFLTCITSFSSKPLEYMLVAGIILLGLTFLAGLALLTYSLFFSNQAMNSTYIILLATSFISAITLSCTGLLGLYLGKIYDEVKQRPRAIVKTIYHGKK